MPETIRVEEPQEADVDASWGGLTIADEVCEAHPSKSFLTHAVIYGLGGLVIQAAAIVLLPFYTHCLEPSDFGILEILNRVGEILNICLMTGGIRLAALTFYNQAKTDADREKTVTSATLVVLLILLAGGSVVVVFPAYIGAIIGLDNRSLVAFGMIAMLLEITTAVPLTLIQARVESLFYISVMMAMFLFRVTLVITAVAVLHWGIWGIMGASALTSILFGAFLTWRELVRGSVRLDFTRFIAILRFALPFIPGGFFFFALRNGDRFFLIKCSGYDALGVYALGYKVATIVGILTIVPLYQVWSARMFATFELRNAPVLIGRVFTRILAAYIFVGMAFVMFADQAIRLLGTPKYYGAMGIVGPIVLAYFFFNAANLMDAAFYVRHKTSIKPWITGASTIVTLGLFAWLIPRYGSMGAACATMGGFAFHAAATWIMSQRVFWVKYESLRLIAMVISALSLVLLSQIINCGLFTTVIKVALWLTWPMSMWFTGLVTDDEKNLIMSAAWSVKGRCRKYCIHIRT